MAKKKVHSTDKVVDKKVNFASLAIAILLFAVAAFGASTLSAADLAILGVSFGITSDEIVAMFSGYVLARDVIGLVFVFICLIFSLIVSIKMIIHFFKLFGFFGKKDANVMKKKLSKYARSVFATIGLEITVLLMASYDNGALSTNATTLMTLAGILFFVLYALVRFYRWFILEKRYWLDCLFEVLKDALFIACPIFLVSMINNKFLGELADDIFMFYGHLEADFLSTQIASVIIAAMTSLVLMFITLGLMRKTMKNMVFNNYKRSAYDVKGSYIALFVIAFLFAAMGNMIPAMINSGFSTDVLVSSLLSSLLSSLPYLLAMVGICVGSAIEESETTKTESGTEDSEEYVELPADEIAADEE